MLWINFLHLYQPANADGHVVKEATEMSYKRLVKALEKHPNIKFTLNITGCLILRWEELKYFDLIKQIRKLVQKGQIELTGSAAYHPLLPLISKKEGERQIQENEDTLRYFFGENIKLRGFFCPEMAYGPEVAKIIKKKGYEWLILDEISYNGKLGQVDFKKIYKDKNSGLKVIFRSRNFSSNYVPKFIAKKIKQKKNNSIVITATDGELYGLRHLDQTGEFEKLLNQKELKTKTISEFISGFRQFEETKLLPSSWEASGEELKEKKPYVLWNDKKNKIQQRLWKLADLSYKTIERYKNDDNYDWARWHLVRGLASCTFWWASAKDFRKVFGPYAWSPDEIERGSNELIRAVRALEDVTTRPTKIKAEKLYIEIKRMVWDQHWHYYWKK